MVNYSSRYGLGSVRAVAVDDAYNIWLLDGERIGVLRAGDTSPRWTSGVGQAAPGFGPDKLALGSTVICGGSAGRAYVGYHTYTLDNAFIYSPDGSNFPRYDDPDPARFEPVRYLEYQKGDLDVVKLQPDGGVVLETHLGRSARGNGPQDIGIRNTNDHHFDEDRSVLSCVKVMRGKHAGQLYIGTNHGVTRIQGLTYNSHRHPGWYLITTNPDGSKGESLQCPPMYGLGLARNGDVLVANEQMLGVLIPSAKLEEWDREYTWAGPTPWRFKSFNEALNGQASDDYWRAFEQTTSGVYYLGSAEFGVWAMTPKSRSAGNWSKLAGLPTNRILSLKSTDDGALYIGTSGEGLWRLEPDGVTLSRVRDVSGQRVLQLVYEPTVTPSMLLVLTDQGLTVLRGP